MMVNVMIVLILLAITSSILWYLVRAKKRGETCIGCPYAKQCASKCNNGCSCSGATANHNQFHD